MRVLGIDYGDRRIGIAVSDVFGWTAQPVETIEWSHDYQKPLQRIRELIEKYETNKIVIGFPKNMNGTIGERGEKTNYFIDALLSFIPDIEISKWDERLSTVSAARTMNELGVKGSKKKKKIVDQIAAVYILQGYLDQQTNR